MISSVLSSQLSVLRLTASRWAVQMKVSVFSSIRLRALAGLRVDLDQPEPLVAAVDLLVGEVVGRPCPRSRGIEVDPIDLRPDRFWRPTSKRFSS